MMNLSIIEVVIVLVILLLILAVIGGIAFALFFVMRRPGAASGTVSENRVPCPYCAEMILPTAKVCRFCGRELPEKTA
jgi:hypothetical protein